MRVTRRLFLSLPAIVPFVTLRAAPSGAHCFSYDHVIGTSLDLVVWTSNADAARCAGRPVHGNWSRSFPLTTIGPSAAEALCLFALEVRIRLETLTPSA